MLSRICSPRNWAASWYFTARRKSPEGTLSSGAWPGGSTWAMAYFAMACVDSKPVESNGYSEPNRYGWSLMKYLAFFSHAARNHSAASFLPLLERSEEHTSELQ